MDRMPERDMSEAENLEFEHEEKFDEDGLDPSDGAVLAGTMRGLDRGIAMAKEMLADLQEQRGRCVEQIKPHLKAAEDLSIATEDGKYVYQEFPKTTVKSYKELWEAGRSKVNPATGVILDALKEEMSTTTTVERVVFKRKGG